MLSSDIVSRLQILKKIFHFSKQVGDYFKPLWPFQKNPKLYENTPIWPLCRLLSSCYCHRYRCWGSWAKRSLSFHCCCWCTNAWRTYYATLLLPKIHPFDHCVQDTALFQKNKQIALACARMSALLMILVTARPLVAHAQRSKEKWPSQRSCVCLTHARARTYKSAPNMLSALYYIEHMT